MTVVFSTYQSIDVVARAQAESGLAAFDLIVCDEAHRTTGVTLADDEDESPFVRVHDSDYIRGAKRIFMTATPRIYDDATKAKAGEAAAVLVSMDDEKVYGPEFYRLGFGEAVEQGLLTDYKVLVLAVDNAMVASTFQTQLADRSGELQLDDVAKIVGCWNGLAKRGQAEHDFGTDSAPMRRAVAFAGTIKASKKVESTFDSVVDEFVASQDTDDEDGSDGASDTVSVLDCEVRHVDGTFNALERNRRLDWLRADVPDGTCRILTNARCLSEGVDVPALDSVMFLAPRRSVVDVVQSVGRVMRKAPGKKYGYIILPIAIPDGVTPEVALRDNARYQVVWEVLQALRAHDERLNAEVNKIDLTSTRSDRINVIGVGAGERSERNRGVQGALALNLAQLDEWRQAIYTRIVAKVGSRRYWEDWARSVAQIAEAHITRITALLATDHDGVRGAFDRFLDGLRANLNEHISQSDAVEMLAQHLITRPVFDALFGGSEFAAQNPVARAMEQMLAVLDEQNLESENADLAGFYESVRMRVAGIDTAEGRQRIIVELYDNFFSTAFRRTVDKLGIVYTPVEIVDFILRSTDEVLRAEFGQGLTDENVHILDGFTGTGTFVARLIGSGLIDGADLARKYRSELHANEILLLAYYIAAVNIETSFQGAMTGHVSEHDYEPFPGLVLTDTFQSYEDGDRLDFEVFRDNNSRLEAQKALPITVIVGNPPYSSGQDSANEGNQNEEYPTLDAAIRRDFSAERGRGGNTSLYDSYIRAIKWASLRVSEQGVIGLVTNGGFIRSSVGQEMRRSLASEFAAIYLYDLRGYGLVGGEEGRREGRPVFEFGGWRPDGSEVKNSTGGSRATIVIVLLVKKPQGAKRPGIHYAKVADYLSAGQKIKAVAAAGSIAALDLELIVPDRHGDWLDHRTDTFATYMPIGAKHGEDVQAATVFALYGRGLETGRDAWVYQSSKEKLANQVRRTIAAFNEQVEDFRPVLAANPSAKADARKRLVAEFIDLDAKRISWTLSLKTRLGALRPLSFDQDNIVDVTYRPFFRQHAYFDAGLNHIRGQSPRFFPTPQHPNFGFVVTGVSSHAPFAVTMVDSLPDLHVLDTGQFFGRWRYEEAKETVARPASLFGQNDETGAVGGYRRIDNITDEALAAFVDTYGDKITKDDVFFYVYGLLHSTDYRTRFVSDLKKTLPRAPLVADPWPFISAGRALADSHLGYEEAAPYPLAGLDVQSVGDPYEFFRVTKLAYPRRRVDGKLVEDKDSLIYNSRITVTGIPEEAQRYMLGTRSALDWLVERWRVTTDKPSGITNDPNDWCQEVGNPRYVLDLVARMVTVSIETMSIVDALPALEVRQPST